MKRAERNATIVLLLTVILSAGAARAADELHAADELRAAERLAWQKRFGEAERQYRDILRREPASRAAALGLGQVLMWEQRYADAASVYRGILSRAPHDVDARKGLATSQYWSGDYRNARREYAAVLRARPGDAEARKAIADIDAAMAPLLTSDNDAVSDDQPVQRSKATVAYTLFTDPLTKWTATAGAYALRAKRLGFGSATSPFAAIAGSTSLPGARLRVSGSLRLFRFPDGATKPLGGVTLAHEWHHSPASTSSVSIEIDRHELLYAASSLAAHASETVTTLGWSRRSDAASSTVALHAIRYFDGNSGRAADAYHLLRVAHAVGGSISVGAAVSYRDSEESRFRLIGASAAPVSGGTFVYSYAARYEPYWTPQNLVEARGIVAATLNAGPATIHLHADGGIGHDRDLLFGPSDGTTVAVPLFAMPIGVSRTFHPWRASAEIVFPLRGRLTATLGLERQTTVFYRADSIHFGFTGRL
jgi:tetratricopeptide (TPR) repeat protein